jgi:3-phenylpropionate/cinnamic acid dioxygenase small subunit
VSSSLSLEDKEAIRDLVVSYARVVDDGSAEEILDLFTDDVVIEGPLSGRHTGRDGVLGWLNSVPDRPPGQDRHILSGILVRGTKDDATATANFAHFRTAPAGSSLTTQVFFVGRFEFTLRRVRGSWLISSRRAVIDSLSG